MDLKQAIFELSATAGTSGMEGETARAAAKLIEPFADSVEIDRMGNVIALRKAAKPNAKRILLDAHLDEICMLVTDHDKGFLKFNAIGIDPRLLPALDVKVCTEPPIMGVINCLPPHLLTEDMREKPFEQDMLRIDCGLSEEEAPGRVPVGTRVVYAMQPFALGEKRVCGKALDDRACFVILARVMELLQDKELPVELCVLGSVQEEYTGLGARTGAFSQMPDQAIVVDVSFAETPDSDKDDTFPLGGGPLLGTGPVMNRKMAKRIRALADEREIPYNVEVLSGDTGTNADDFQMAREGIPVVCVSLPLRYMHTPCEVVDLNDVEHTAQLLAAYILSQEVDAP